MTAIKIGIVDDHPLFREGVNRSLSEMTGFVVVGEGASSADAANLAELKRPDIILLDISMPGGGVNAIGEIHARSPGTKIIMLTADESLETLAAAIQRGAVGYIVKGIGSKGLADAIRKASHGTRIISPVLSEKLAERTLSRQMAPAILLTPREKEVMELVAEGLSNKHIGLRLDMQEKTVKHHMTQILLKVGAANRTEAAIKWRSAHQ